MKNLRKKVSAIIALLTVVSTLARANDSAIQGTGGAPTALGSLKKVAPLKGEHPAIRMVRERVSMTIINSEYYDVVADFVFHNDGAARNVLMGFPEGAGGDTDFKSLEKKTAFKNFRTTVDGRPIAARRIPIIEKDQDYQEDFQAYWVKSVRFEKHQTHNVRVSYRALLGSTTGSKYVYYDFTGGNWKGKVAESTLSVKFVAPGNYRVWPRENDEKSKPQNWRRGDTFFFRWKNWQAQDGFGLRFASTLPGTLVETGDPKDLNEPWDVWSNTTDLSIPSRAKNFDPYRVATSYHTDFILRDGRAFVSARAFYDHLQYAFANRQVQDDNPSKPKPWNGNFSWDAQTRSARLRWPHTGAPGKQHILAVMEGALLFKLDGHLVKLSTPIFMAGSPQDESLYIPLLPLLKALGGKAKVNTKTHRVWFDVPV